jgi:hypothetical protein
VTFSWVAHLSRFLRKVGFPEAQLHGSLIFFVVAQHSSAVTARSAVLTSLILWGLQVLLLTGEEHRSFVALRVGICGISPIRLRSGQALNPLPSRERKCLVALFLLLAVFSDEPFHP